MTKTVIGRLVFCANSAHIATRGGGRYGLTAMDLETLEVKRPKYCQSRDAVISYDDIQYFIETDPVSKNYIYVSHQLFRCEVDKDYRLTSVGIDTDYRLKSIEEAEKGEGTDIFKFKQKKKRKKQSR